MKLVSVNVGGARALEVGHKRVQTGIFKTPRPDPVVVGDLGLTGDVQVDQRHHGGPDQAVYLYSQEDYSWFVQQLGRTLEPGTFGENLTLSSYGAPQLYIGDRFAVGEVLLELTSPRIPCGTFAARMGDEGFVRRFKEAERPGVYARVVQGGTLQAGDAVRYSRGASDVSVLELFRLVYDKAPSAERLRRVLGAPVDARTRTAFESELARLRE